MPFFNIKTNLGCYRSHTSNKRGKNNSRSNYIKHRRNRPYNIFRTRRIGRYNNNR